MLRFVGLVVLLGAFLCLGVAQIINPDWFIKRSGVRKGGELLSDFNRLEFQIVGALFVGFAVYLLYVIFHNGFSS